MDNLSSGVKHLVTQATHVLCSRSTPCLAFNLSVHLHLNHCLLTASLKMNCQIQLTGESLVCVLDNAERNIILSNLVTSKGLSVFKHSRFTVFLKIVCSEQRVGNFSWASSVKARIYCIFSLRLETPGNPFFHIISLSLSLLPYFLFLLDSFLLVWARRSIHLISCAKLKRHDQNSPLLLSSNNTVSSDCLFYLHIASAYRENSLEARILDVSPYHLCFWWMNECMRMDVSLWIWNYYHHYDPLQSSCIFFLSSWWGMYNCVLHVHRCTSFLNLYISKKEGRLEKARNTPDDNNIYDHVLFSTPDNSELSVQDTLKKKKPIGFVCFLKR